jgi:hypothetical protein
MSIECIDKAEGLLSFDLCRDLCCNVLKIENHQRDLDIRLIVHRISHCAKLPETNFLVISHLRDVCSHIQQLSPLFDSAMKN